MAPRKPKQDLAKKTALEKEVVHVLETYGKRLLAVQRTMRDKGEYDKIVKQIENIRLENDNALKRLRDNIRTAARSADQQRDVLGTVWNITRMKAVYHPVLNEAFEVASICTSWRHRLSVLEVMEMHNQAIFGHGRDDTKNYVSMFTYPSIVKDHLFNVQHILEKYDKIISCPAHKRVVDLISWLDREQTTLTSIKGLNSATIAKQIRKPDEVVLQRSMMKMPMCDSGDASNAELFLSESLVAVRTMPGGIGWIFGKGKTESSPMTAVEVEEGGDDVTLNLLGLGLRKVLIADNREKRDEWLTSFKEIKKNGIRTSR